MFAKLFRERPSPPVVVLAALLLFATQTFAEDTPVSHSRAELACRLSSKIIPRLHPKARLLYRADGGGEIRVRAPLRRSLRGVRISLASLLRFAPLQGTVVVTLRGKDHSRHRPTCRLVRSRLPSARDWRLIVEKPPRSRQGLATPTPSVMPTPPPVASSTPTPPVVPTATGTPSIRPHPVGMNAAAGIVDWAVGHLFKNVFKGMRGWTIVPYSTVTSEESLHLETLRSEVAIPSDSNGYPHKVPFYSNQIRRCNGAYSDSYRGCSGSWGESIPLAVISVFFTDHTFYPAGNYTLLVEGTGSVKFGLDSIGEPLRWVDIPIAGPGKTALTIPIANGGNATALFYITSSQEGNHIRNLKLLFPGVTEADEEASPLFEPYLEGLRPFGAIRTWGEPYLPMTSPSDRLEWSERVLPSFYTQTAQGGMAWEYRVDAANALGVDMWITAPYHASDSYIRQLAQLIRTRLRSDLRVLIEYSNETWNYAGDFGRAREFTGAQGIALGLVPPGAPIEHANSLAGHYFHTLRTLQIGRIFTEELGSQRVQVVLGSQAANAYGVSSLRLQALNDSNVRALVGGAIPPISYLAVAPYFGNSTTSELVNDPTINIFTMGNAALLNTIFQRATQYMACHTFSWIRDHRTVLNQFNQANGTQIKLAAYEIGQHLVADSFDHTTANPSYQYRSRTRAEVVQRLGAIFRDANRDARMADLYRQLYNVWFSEQGDLMMNFFYVESPSITSGAWGMIEYLVDRNGARQPITQSSTPKMFAALSLVNRFVTGQSPVQGTVSACIE